MAEENKDNFTLVMGIIIALAVGGVVLFKSQKADLLVQPHLTAAETAAQGKAKDLNNKMVN